MKPRYTLTQDNFSDTFEAVNFKDATDLAKTMLDQFNETVHIHDHRAHKDKPKVYDATICTGAAHSNPWIDNCMVCMPRWGIVVRPQEIKTPVS